MRKRLGMITPSSNTVLEPVTCTMLREVAGVTASLERDLDVMVLDAVAVTLWRTMQLAGADPRTLASWGRLFGS
jgi:maleate isomerase